MTLTLCRTLASAAIAAASVAAAHAQPSPNCGRLEAQLASFDRSVADSGRGEQARRYEEAIGKQQAEIDRAAGAGAPHRLRQQQLFCTVQRRARRMRPAQCQDPADAGEPRPHPGRPRPHPGWRRQCRARQPAPRRHGGAGAEQLRPAIPPRPPRRARAASSISCSAATRRSLSPACQRAQSVGAERQLPHHLRAHLRRLLFPDLVLRPTRPLRARTRRPASGCVRRRRSCCSPIATGRGRHAGDLDQRPALLGAAERVQVPPGFDDGCSCKQPGESWADALGKDEVSSRGDVVVTEERAKQLSPPPRRRRASRAPRSRRPPARAARAPPAAETARAWPTRRAPTSTATKPDPNRASRAVGPTFMPGR